MERLELGSIPWFQGFPHPHRYPRDGFRCIRDDYDAESACVYIWPSQPLQSAVEVVLEVSLTYSACWVICP